MGDNFELSAAEIAVLKSTIDGWYLYNRPMVAWWRIPPLDLIRARVEKILSVKMEAIVVDSLEAMAGRHERAAADNMETSNHYAGLYSADDEVCLRFAELAAEETAEATKIRTLMKKIEWFGLPRCVAEYVPEITIAVM